MAVVNFNSSAVPQGSEDIARMIVSRFAEAGFGEAQQLAALANAIAESGLNPAAVAVPPDASTGLFQLNRNGGLGTGFTKEQLCDAGINVSIVLREAMKHAGFAKAASLRDAVAAFVKEIERPADPDKQIAKRLQIAEGLAASS